MRAPMTDDELLQAADAVQTEFPSATVTIGRSGPAVWLVCRNASGRCFATAACRDGSDRWLAGVVSSIKKKWKT